MRVTCCVSASPSPTHHTTSTLQSLLSTPTPCTPCLLTLTSDSSSLALMPSLLTLHSPHLTSLLQDSRDTLVILLPPSLSPALPLLPSLILTGDCSGSRCQLESVKSLLKLLGCHLDLTLEKENVVGCDNLNLKVEVKEALELMDNSQETEEEIICLLDDDSQEVEEVARPEEDIEATADGNNSDLNQEPTNQSFQISSPIGSFMPEQKQIPLSKPISIPLSLLNSKNQLDIIAGNNTVMKKDQSKNPEKISKENPKLFQVEHNILCDHCNFQTTSMTQINIHMKRKHAEVLEAGKICCKFCKFKTKSKAHMTHHMKHEHDLEPPSEYPCNFNNCSYVAKNIYHLKRHSGLKHSEDTERFPCPSCDTTFATKWSVKTHIKRKHSAVISNPEKRILVCKLCDYNSTCRTALTKHVKSAHGIFKLVIKHK